MRLCLLMLLVTVLSGCTWSVKPDTESVTVETVTRPAQMPVFQPPKPIPLRLEPVQWYVITQENLEEKVAEISELSGDGEFVVFAVTPMTYENLSWNMQELQRYHRQLLEIVLYYEDANTQTAPAEPAPQE